MGWKQYIVDPLRWLDALIADHVGPVRVLFVVSNAIGCAHQLPLIRALAGRPGFRVSVAVDHGAPIDHALMAAHFADLPVRFLSPYWAVWRKWHYVFFTDMMRMHFRRWATLFLLRHGPCWGNFDRAQTYGEPKKFDEYGDLVVFKNRAAFSQATSHGALAAFYRRNRDLWAATCHRPVVIGVPKLDAYQPLSAAARRAGLEKLGLDPSRPTVVVTSHWSAKGVLPVFGADLIERLLAHPAHCNLIILGHEKIWQGAIDGSNARAVAMRQRIETLGASTGRIYFALTEVLDNAFFLGLGDAFICDKSSIFVECLLFDRPILFFRNPDFHFKDEGVGAAFITASHLFRDLDALDGVLETALAGPLQYADRRRRSLAYLLSYQGHGTARAVDLLERLGRLSGQRSVRWDHACVIVDGFNGARQQPSLPAELRSRIYPVARPRV
ncbi:MAG: hypothetical protein Tsb0016_26730 [Sphingomonadales bacterium]